MAERINMGKQSEKAPSFEQALAELEKLVTQVEQGKIPLEESLDKYEQGMKLIRHCRSILESAERRIEEIGKEMKSPSEQPGDAVEEKATGGEDIPF